MPSCSSLQLRGQIKVPSEPSYHLRPRPVYHKRITTTVSHSCSSCFFRQNHIQALGWESAPVKSKEGTVELGEGEEEEEEEEEPEKIELSKRTGTVSGAVALIVGTSIGSGILALPMKASPAVSHF